ncbi:MAG: enolase C-terminal domain-like protein [Candidatus Nanoarchaeia archaeon]|nr:enolase C-terminal domain-like protein [Candidatus Nanoarchaeia archaeon]MDD5357643.1 enolase C-terminal domain-like protein [Candidatus Nanoarchaeia archaeon]MDD5588562.1 enolase C-terminal domain-like protein [Candidatus Nanoarchaeia archaeon]
MKIKSVSAKSILDSRGEKTILVTIKTNVGEFSASSPSGKSTGKFEAKPYKKNIEGDIEKIEQLSDYFSDEIEEFDDLRKVDDIVDKHLGANTIFAMESAILKALAEEDGKEIWELIDSKIANAGGRFPRLVGNCVGGGKHSILERKPDFQEFELIPDGKTVGECAKINNKAKKETKEMLGKVDKKFSGKKNDEDAWAVSLNEKEVLEVLKKTKIPLGVDIAASGFYKRWHYYYENPKLKRSKAEQLDYISNLIRNFDLYYVEDPFEEDDFENFAELHARFPDILIVGDDLTTTNPERLKKAIKMKSINAIIVKPNQIGSLMKVKEVCELAKKNNIKIVFSHRSGETEESILADLAFGFQADFLKCGITGSEREVKINRLIEIEKEIK